MLQKGRRYHALLAVYVYFHAMSPKLCLLLCVVLVGCNHNQSPEAGKPNPATKPATVAVAAGNEWKPLFDGKTLTNWQTAEFGAHGEPYAKDGVIVLPVGDPMTG